MVIVLDLVIKILIFLIKNSYIYLGSIAGAVGATAVYPIDLGTKILFSK